VKAIRFDRHGGSEVLALCDAPEPRTPQAGEVTVAIQAAALNHLDIWVRNGFPNIQLSLPRIPGCDGAGMIADVGAGVKDLKPGDRVVLSPGMGCGICERCTSGWDSLCDSFHILGFQIDGTYAQRITVPARRVIRVSQKYSFEEWAGVPLVFLTAWHMLVAHAKVQAGQNVLVHAAGSGVGSAGIQIAKLFGAQVITTVGDDSKIEKAKALGAHHVINYKTSDFAEETKKITAQNGADIIFEHIGPETWHKNLACLAKKGHMVTCGATSGPKVEFDLRFIYMRQQSITGSYMGGRAELLRVIELVEKGALKPAPGPSFGLTAAKAAQDLMESRKFFGKITLKTTP